MMVHVPPMPLGGGETPGKSLGELAGGKIHKLNSTEKHVLLKSLIKGVRDASECCMFLYSAEQASH